MSVKSAAWRVHLTEMSRMPAESLECRVATALTGMDDCDALGYLVTMYCDDPKGTPEFDVAALLLHVFFADEAVAR